MVDENETAFESGLDDPTPAAAETVVDELDDFAKELVSDDPEPETPVAEEATETEETETPETEEETTETEEPEETETPEEEEEPESEEETTETEEPEEPETPSNKDHWNALRGSRDRHKAASEEKDALLAERDQEIADLKSKNARLTELEEKLKVFDEQEKELAVARVESTREYKENIEAPLQAIGNTVEALTQSNEADVDAAFRMLREADPIKQRTMLKELTAGWDEIDRIDLKKAADDARVLLDKQEAMRANAHAAQKERDEIAARRDAEAKEATKKEYLGATKDVVKEIREKLPFTALSEGETEDDRYESLAQKLQNVDFDGQSVRAKALAAASALALPQAIKTIAAKDKEIAELKAAVAKASKAKPSVSPKKESAPEPQDKDFFEEFGISEPSAMFGSRGLDVRG